MLVLLFVLIYLLHFFAARAQMGVAINNKAGLPAGVCYAEY